MPAGRPGPFLVPRLLERARDDGLRRRSSRHHLRHRRDLLPYVARLGLRQADHIRGRRERRRLRLRSFRPGRRTGPPGSSSGGSLDRELSELRRRRLRLLPGNPPIWKGKPHGPGNMISPGASPLDQHCRIRAPALCKGTTARQKSQTEIGPKTQWNLTGHAFLRNKRPAVLSHASHNLESTRALFLPQEASAPTLTSLRPKQRR